MIFRSQQGFKSEAHHVFAEELNKIELNSNDDKKLQFSDRIASHPYGVNAGIVSKI